MTESATATDAPPPAADLHAPSPAPRARTYPGATAFDRAEDLWGRPPRGRHACRGCGHPAEPYQGAYCWLCVHGGVPVPGGAFVPVEQHQRATSASGRRGGAVIRDGGAA